MNNELPYSFLRDKLRQLKASEVVINPCLAALYTFDRFDTNVPGMFTAEARNFSNNCLTESDIIQHFNILLNPRNFPISALCEIFASTALFIAHEQAGNLFVDEKIAQEAMSRVKYFCKTSSISNLLHLYQIISTHTNLNALSHYDGIPEQEFLLGSWHRPWVKHFLSDDLRLGALSGIMEVKECKGERYVQITSKGVETLQNITLMLEGAGYFAQSISLLHISQFNTYDEYEKLAEGILPEFMQIRKQLIDFAAIQPGMRVLELGCGSGLLTFEAGLADQIGPKGELISIDPSSKMINRAKAKPQAKEKNWVKFRIGIAEDLPFENDNFDAVIGSAFLHFTDPKLALKEMRRVTRSAGIIASFHPLSYDFSNVPFFNEWFSPIFQLAAKRKEQPKNFLFSAEKGLEAFEEAGLTKIESRQFSSPNLFHDPNKVIKHYIHGLGFYQEELADLPWKKRQDIMESLLEKGRYICLKYTIEDRSPCFPVQMIKGSVS
jgi:ubiquinone/menaquinone biosynthesis C-methylase UbiE